MSWRFTRAERDGDFYGIEVDGRFAGWVEHYADHWVAVLADDARWRWSAPRRSDAATQLVRAVLGYLPERKGVRYDYDHMGEYKAKVRDLRADSESPQP